MEGVHPRVCDSIVSRLKLKCVSRAIYKPVHDWGIEVDRQLAQAVLFAVFVNNPETFSKR